MRLNNYGYNVTANTKVRRMSLGKAVKSVGYKRVKSALSSRMSRESSGYKVKRYRADRNWLKRKHSKYY